MYKLPFVCATSVWTLTNRIRQLFSQRNVGLVAKWQEQDKWASSVVAKHRLFPIARLNHFSVHVRLCCCPIVICAWVIDTSIIDPMRSQVLFKLSSWCCWCEKAMQSGNLSQKLWPDLFYYVKNVDSMFFPRVKAHVTQEWERVMCGPLKETWRDKQRNRKLQSNNIQSVLWALDSYKANISFL